MGSKLTFDAPIFDDALFVGESADGGGLGGVREDCRCVGVMPGGALIGYCPMGAAFTGIEALGCDMD